ncbi:MAG: NAD(P)H-hydrate dehydratase [Lachnospiraceae bacterium]|nr:NAD(P)H-hydrate dehydratase [Lachnospiraceae bacterium]
MKILLDSRQMKQCDKNTIDYFGVPSLVLMERAALGVAEEIERYFPEHKEKVLCVCGQGNNGGDGLAIGRILWQRGYHVTIVMIPGKGRLSEETRTQAEILKRYGIEIWNDIPEGFFDVTVDALFGIGLTRELEGIYREVIEAMNQMPGMKIAVDLPSGIQADTGQVMGIGFRADLTVTFAFSKRGLLLYPGAEYAGRVLLKDIGIDEHSFLEENPQVYYMEPWDLKMVPFRRPYSNKGSYGKVLTVAGRKNMAGAAFLSGKASYVTGAGLVRLLTEEENRVILQQLLPEAVLTTYEEKESLSEFLPEALNQADVIVAGPGLGMGERAELLIETILKQAEVPVILDADGLNVVAEHLEWLREAKGPVVVTPHLGEMERLTKKGIFEIQKELLQTAQEFALEYNVICVLKDARTITALPDGKIYVNVSGNNGMATAGSGDVLTGILAGLAAQGMELCQAAPVGVYLHGAAGDSQRRYKGTYGMTAQDLLTGIGEVLREQEIERIGEGN